MRIENGDEDFFHNNQFQKLLIPHTSNNRHFDIVLVVITLLNISPKLNPIAFFFSAFPDPPFKFLNATNGDSY